MQNAEAVLGIIRDTGEPDAVNAARPVRWGAVGKGPTTGTSLAAYPTSSTVLWEPGGEIPPGHPTGSACHATR